MENYKIVIISPLLLFLDNHFSNVSKLANWMSCEGKNKVTSVFITRFLS